MTKWYAVYQKSDGRLVSTGTVVADPLPEGLVAASLSEAPNFAKVEWNPKTKKMEATKNDRTNK